MYKRIVLKISGEQLAGKHDSGIDPEAARFFAREIQQIADKGVQVVVIAGGGNMVRGRDIAKDGIKRVTADQMGMLSGLINAIALTDVFESAGLQTRCLSTVFAQQIAESYSFRLAEKHLQKGRVTIIAGGTARPYVTHDTAAVMIGLELDCELVIKATKVDGVYDKDPAKFKDAKLFDRITFQQAIENTAIQVMDKAALGLALEQKQQIVVYNSLVPGNLLKIVNGENVGTKIS